jgi:hypothetical protein
MTALRKLGATLVQGPAGEKVSTNGASRKTGARANEKGISG